MAASWNPFPTLKFPICFHESSEISICSLIGSSTNRYQNRRQEMSHGVISLSQASFSPCKKPNPLAVNFILEPSSIISFNTQLPKQGISFKIPSGHYKTRPKASLSHVCAATESFYDLLGISEDGTTSEIKQAYKQLARKYHPDVSPPDCVEEYTKRFIQVHEAYKTLSDPHRRALCDRDLARALNMAFSARKQSRYKEAFDDRTEWKHRWWSQLTELKRRSMNKDSRGNLSWGAQMRRKRSEAAGCGSG